MEVEMEEEEEGDIPRLIGIIVVVGWVHQPKRLFFLA